MSTCQAIIRRAMRLMGVTSAGQEPAGPDAEDGMEALQSLILTIPGLILNGRWRDRSVSAAHTARESDRLTVASPGSVTLPLTVTWAGHTRHPHDLAKVQIIGAAENAGLWLYSATKGAWGQADGLENADEMPTGIEDDAGIAAQLAVNMMDEYSAQLGARTLALAMQSARSLRSRLKKFDHEIERHHHHGEPAIWDYP